MNDLFKAIEEAKSDKANFSMMFCGMTGYIHVSRFQGARLCESKDFKREEVQQAVDWVKSKQHGPYGLAVSDYLEAFEQGGHFQGKPERQWLGEFLTQFDDWLLSNPEKTRRLLLHMFNSEWHEEMVDRIVNQADYEIRRYG